MSVEQINIERVYTESGVLTDNKTTTIKYKPVACCNESQWQQHACILSHDYIQLSYAL